MKIIWTEKAWGEILYWAKNDKKILARIINLIDAIEKNPFEGIGKPEGLRNNLSGFWSRRINDEHRLVYKFENNEIKIIQARYHYKA